MPLLLAGCKPDHISWMDLLTWTALSLCTSATGGHDQSLPKWMVCQAVCAPGSNMTLAPATNADQGR